MAPQRVYYLDHNATTPVAPKVLEAMLPFLTGRWANPSSSYTIGREVAAEVDAARAKVAQLIGADPGEIVFTSCGTESNNAAIHSALVSQPDKRHVLMTAVEHSANINYGEDLLKRGYSVTYLPVDSDGLLDLRLLERSIRPDTAIVSVMWANNETGVVFPVEEIAPICRSKGVLFHTDAVQAAGKVWIDVRSAGVDFLSLSAHKLYAPKGIGLLYIRSGAPFEPFIIGGHQEHGRRGGTENVAHIAGFGRAAELALASFEDDNRRIRTRRDRLEEGILRTIPNTALNGAKEPRLPNTTNLAFEGLEGDAILIALDQIGICASSGSACTAGAIEPSHVLRAMGLSVARARSSIRFSLGRETSPDDVEYVLSRLPKTISKLRFFAGACPKNAEIA
jgi:cysteine desulfurase